jgi:hypothetical protein
LGFTCYSYNIGQQISTRANLSAALCFSEVDEFMGGEFANDLKVNIEDVSFSLNGTPIFIRSPV